MASLTKKKVNGHTYWYLRELRRVDGKPKIVWTRCLGKADDILRAFEAIETPPEPRKVAVTQFGAVTALFDMARQVGLVEIVDRRAPKRDQGLTTGEYILLAAVNRAVCPKIEDVFKLMKHPQFLRWQPQWCWTDSKIRVHAFTCALAVTLCSLLQRTLARRGMDISIPRCSMRSAASTRPPSSIPTPLRGGA